MSKESILERIICIIKRLNMGKNPALADDINKELLCSENRFYARDLMVLYCEVEKEFNIQIPVELFEKYGFRTLKNIVDIVYETVRR